ncbi:MAG: restriction endonuclease subunit S [Methylobacter sp.]
MKLGEEIDLLTGFPFESKKYSDDKNDIKLLRGDNIVQGGLRWDDVKRWPVIEKSKYQNYELQIDDVVLAMDRPWVGAGLKFSTISENDLPCLLVQRTARMRGGKNLDSRYLKYIIGSPCFSKYIQKITTGSLVPYIRGRQIKDFSCALPSLIEQQKIAGVLSAIDAKIELNNRINAELEAMAKTLYDYWFVQFDFPFDFASCPEQRRREGKPDANGKPYKSSGGKMVYNPILKRDIPAGWEVTPLANWIASDKTGDWGEEAPKGNYTLQVDCIRGADINGLNGSGKTAAPSRFIFEKNHHKILLPYDFIIEISGGSPTQSTGRMAFLIEETLSRFSYPLICSNFCKAISLKENIFFYNFAYQWVNIYDSGLLFGWEGKTSGIKNLLFDAFVNKHMVCKAPKELAQKFFSFADPLQKKKQKLLKENEYLESLRDWLLPMLMNGQVTVQSSTE